MRGYKAFTNEMTCLGFKFKEGETYETKKAKCCEVGFHFCENPLDCLNYYNVCESRFHEVEAVGEIDKASDDSKIATTKIKIGAKLDINGFVQASVKFLLEKCTDSSSQQAASGYSSQQAASGDSSQQAASGNSSKQAASGNHSQQAASGNDSKQAASGNHSQQELNGEDSIAVSAGHDSKAKGKKGCWIALSEWKYDKKKLRMVPVCVKAAKIDGKRLKENTWYRLKNKKFVEVPL